VGYTVGGVRGWRLSELGDAATDLATANSDFEAKLNAARAVAHAVEVLQYTVDLDPTDYNTANIDVIRTTGRSTRTVELGD
jgi:hypothetical protein